MVPGNQWQPLPDGGLCLVHGDAGLGPAPPKLAGRETQIFPPTMRLLAFACRER